MSIKNDIEMIKEELTSEEKFFEKSVITERFIKKYKNMLIGGVVAIVVFVGANIAYESNQESTALAANEALNELLVNGSDDQALLRLQALNPSLHDAYVYSQAIVNKDLESLQKLQDSESSVISDLATYESAQSIADLDAYALEQGSIYKDLAQVQSAIILINDGKIDNAHEKLLLISENSSLYQTAKALLHYGVK